MKFLRITKKRDIAAALAVETRTWARKRLIAIRAVVAGKTNAAAARAAKAGRTSVTAWRRRARGGMSALLASHRGKYHRRADMALEHVPVCLEEIDAALAREETARRRTRLRAVCAIFAGAGYADAARAAGVSHGSVYQWVRRVRERGWAALLCDGRTARHIRYDKQTIRTSPGVATARDKIRAALACLPPEPRRRNLAALELALSGEVEQAAAVARVAPGTVKSWIRSVCAGAIPFLGQDAHLKANLGDLHACATREKNPNIRKRILAVTYVSAGMSPREAGHAAHVSLDTVYVAVRRFKREGFAAFQDKPIRGRSPKLTAEQLQALEQIVRKEPGATLAQLQARIRGEFGVQYTPNGVATLLRNQLGI